MARTPSITQEQVNLAAAELVAAGKTPGVRGIRELLGVGSNQTIQAMLATWQKSQPTPASAEQAEVPPALLQALQIALGQAKQETAAEYQQALASAHAQRDRATQDALTQYTEFERQLKLAKELTEENIALRTTTLELQKQVEALSTADTARQAAEKEVSALRAQVVQLEARISEQAATAKATTQNHEQAVQDLIAKHEAALLAKAKRHEQAVQDLTAKHEAALLAQAERHEQALQTQKALAQEALSAERAEVKRLRDLNSTTEAALAGKTATVQAIEKQLTEMGEKLKHSESQRTTAEQRAATAEAQVTALSGFEKLAEGLQQRISALETQTQDKEQKAAQKPTKR